jgi:murein DD-endopeptidase MepM/ murein hydrolase activator NlpD
MKNKHLKNIGVSMLLAAVFVVIFPTAKGDRYEALQQKQLELNRIEEDFLEYQDQLRSEFFSEKAEKAERLTKIRNQIESELLEFDANKRASQESEEKLEAIRDQIGTLRGQMLALEISMDVTKDHLNAVQSQIVKRMADLWLLTEEAERLDAQIDGQKKIIISFLRLLQLEDDLFGISDESRNTLRILLSDESFSKNYWETQQVRALENIGRDMLSSFEENQVELRALSEMTKTENKKLSDLHDQKKQEEERLEQQMRSASTLKKSAEMSEESFARLYEESRAQMRESAMVIAQLQDNKDLLRQQMDLLDAEYQDQQKAHSAAMEQSYEKGEEFLKEDANDPIFSWPVVPARGLSAYFLDESYEDYFGIKHYAIDIPVLQGTNISAPALGYVYKVSDNGMGYSSIILAHRNNFMTVYGHVSDIFVEEGQLIQKGDVIGLSGGIPGTKGAGLMTTGPHLHFEVFKDGSHVNPIEYLPLGELPREYIPKRFLKQEK